MTIFNVITVVAQHCRILWFTTVLNLTMHHKFCHCSISLALLNVINLMCLYSFISSLLIVVTLERHHCWMSFSLLCVITVGCCCSMPPLLNVIGTAKCCHCQILSPLHACHHCKNSSMSAPQNVIITVVYNQCKLLSLLSTGNVQNHSYKVGNLSVFIVVSYSPLKGKVEGSNLSRDKIDEKVSLKFLFH